MTLVLAVVGVGATPALPHAATTRGQPSTPQGFGTPDDAVRLEWAYTAPGSGIGLNGLEVADLNGNGQRRIVAANIAGYWQILRSDGGSYVQEWASEYYPGGIRALQVMNVDQDPAPEVLVALDSKILVYKGNPPVLQREVPAAGVRGNFAVADVDGDGSLELVYGGDPIATYYSRTLYVVDFTTGALEYTGPGMGGVDLAVGNVDNDPGLEIVVTGYVSSAYGITAPGYVLDGKTRAIKWTRPEGFGDLVRLGDLNGDGRQEIVGAWDWYVIRVFDAVSRSEVGSITTSEDIDSLLVADVEGDGPLEIVYGDAQWGAVHVLNGQSRAQKWAVTTPTGGANQLALGDTDGDGINELVWCEGYWSTAGDYLFVADTATHAVEWQSVALQPPFSFTSGDFDGDGKIKVLSASASSDEGYEGGYWFLHDGSSHRLEAQGLFGNQNSGPNVAQIRSANVDADPQDEFFINREGSGLACYDGLTRAVQWSTGPSESGGWFSAFDLGDVDGDGALDLVGIAQGKVYVYDATSGALKWTSPAMATGWNPLLRLANVDGDARAKIIVGPTFIYTGPLPPSAPLYILDAVAGTLQSEIVPPFSALELFDADGDGRQEILLGDDNGNVWLTTPEGAAPRLLAALGAPRVNAIRVADFDGHPGPEMLVVRANEMSLHALDGTLLWRSGPIDWGRDLSLGQYDHVHVGDFDGDGRPEFIVGIGWGFRVYEVQALPEIRASVDDVVVSEGNGGAIARFTVTLSEPSSASVKVSYTTRPGTADAGTDFVPASGVLTFSPGVTSQPIDIAIVGDRRYEADETFDLLLTGTEYARLGDAVGRATITNDDSPGLFVSGVTVKEPESGAVAARFEVALVPPLTTSVSVDYGTEDGTATAIADYLPAAGHLTFAPGEGLKPVTVDVRADDITEVTETFSLKLANAQGVDIVEGSGVGNIIDSSVVTFSTVTPCRLFDSRTGPPLAASHSMSVPASGQCGVPAGTRALAINVTVVAPTAAGHLVVFGEGDPPPGTSTVNFAAGQTRANNAIIPLGPSGVLRVSSGQASGTTHVVLDVTGYFQ